jgi:hypothetical protein
MIRIIAALFACVAFVSVYAIGPSFGASCSDEAATKKLAGAAKKSFLTKCEKDAMAGCDIKAKEQKLAGAAKNSFTKKCVTDAVGG